MLMDSFEVENFRSLKHLKLEKLARVNLLVGKNNSGKTSVLEAVFAMMGIEADWVSIIEDERELSSNSRDLRYLFYAFDSSNTISFLAKQVDAIEKLAGGIQLVHVIIKSRDNSSAREREISNRDSRNTTMRRISVPSLTIQIELSSVTKPYIFNLTHTDKNEVLLTPISTNAKKVDEEEGSIFTHSRYETGEILTTSIDRTTLSRKIEWLKFNKLENSFIEILKSVDSRIQNVELGAGGQIYLDLGEKFRTLLPLNLMGEGIQRLLDIISAFADKHGGIVLIDEIDNGLHYSVLRILWKGILQAAREYDVQVFATTHSAEALRHLTWVLDDDCKDYRDDVAAYTLIRAKDDTVRSYRYDYEQLDFAMEHDIEVRN